MGKVPIGANTTICPMPVTLIGSLVNGRPNFMTVAFISRVCLDPPLVSMGLNKRSATREAVLKNRAFSVNFPTAAMVKETDYCGIVSANNTDKSMLFEVFYGKNPAAPMIQRCPLSLECSVAGTHDFQSHTCIIGEITAAHIDECCLTARKPDPKKINPLLLTVPDNRYWALGESVGCAWSAGKELVKGK
ncbi:MAG TPA: flavin reductase family protein [Methanoregula sp.]|nr:flavin reductase family protein [Methanoregula sp.]